MKSTVPTNSPEWPTWHHPMGKENIGLGPVLTTREFVHAASFVPVSLYLWFIVTDYSKSVQIVSYALSGDLVLSENTGLFNPAFSVSQWNIFWPKQSANQIVSFNSCYASKKIILPPLGDLKKDLASYFGMVSVWSPKCKFLSMQFF